jgi:hypothetical protein
MERQAAGTETAAFQDRVGIGLLAEALQSGVNSSSTAALTPNNRGDVRACSQLLFIHRAFARTARRLRPPLVFY